MYRSSDLRVTCVRCTQEILADSAQPIGEGQLCARCTAAVLPARAAVLVIGCIMAWSFVGLAESAIQWLLVRIDGPSSFGTRLSLLLCGGLVNLVALALAVDVASSARRLLAWCVSRATRIALIAGALLSLPAFFGSIWIQAAAQRIALYELHTSDLVLWTEQTVTLTIVHAGQYAVTLLAMFLYALWRWQKATAASSPAAAQSPASS
jgi:hypothetical protein